MRRRCPLECARTRRLLREILKERLSWVVSMRNGGKSDPILRMALYLGRSRPLIGRLPLQCRGLLEDLLFIACRLGRNAKPGGSNNNHRLATADIVRRRWFGVGWERPKPSGLLERRRIESEVGDFLASNPGARASVVAELHGLASDPVTGEVHPIGRSSDYLRAFELPGKRYWNNRQSEKTLWEGSEGAMER